MPGNRMVCQITDTNIGTITDDSSPILVACIRKDADYQENLILLEFMAAHYHGRLRVSFALEDMFAYFRDMYAINGTPTFLIFRDGRAIGSVLGSNPYYKLIEYVDGILQDNQDDQERLRK